MHNLQFDDVVLKIRSATQSEWLAQESSDVLSEGEPGYATDTYVIKFGDGRSLWKDLPSVNSKELAELLELINKKYTKPEGGIPASDLSSDIQAALTNTWEV